MKAFDIRLSYIGTPLRLRCRNTRKSSAMASYFRKKEPLETALPEDAGEEYRKELKTLLTAYFYPLKDGFSAADVERFFESGGGVSFEQYLRDKHLIADIGDIEALKEKYGLADKKAVSVTVDKNNLSVIDD